MSAHTRGPWIWARGHRGLYGAGPDNAVLDYAHYEGMWLASPNEVANARLIAAAPLMYDFVASKAGCGDNDAIKIMEVINGSA